VGSGRVSSPPSATDRLVQTAYGLFKLHGVHPVGVDRIARDAELTKTTLYRSFRSKRDLALATLDLYEQLWTNAWLITEVERRAEEPEERLLAIFDAFDDWFNRPDYESCYFTCTLLEFRDDGSIRDAAAEQLSNVRVFVRRLAEEARVRDPDAFAQQWQALMIGAIVAASEGRLSIAPLVRDAGAILLEHERRSRDA
jgi:AcrR family transcriptional regulator